jgi:hypothetical protein
MEQGGEGSSLADVFKVLYEPGATFERVRARPSFLMPFIVICVVQIAFYFLNMPFMRAGMAAQMATRPAGGPDPSKFLVFGAIFIPVGIGIALVIGGGLLWVLVSLFGGEAKFGTLMSVATFASVPSVILLAIVGAIVLQMKGAGQITSMQDLQPALGLDLLVPSAGVRGGGVEGGQPVRDLGPRPHGDRRFDDASPVQGHGLHHCDDRIPHRRLYRRGVRRIRPALI